MDKNQLKHIIKEEYQNVKSFMEDKYGFTPELGKVISNPYAKSFVNEVQEPEVISQLRNILKNKQNAKIKDPKSGKMMRVDSFSASAVIAVYDAINDSNKKNFGKLSLPKMVNVAFKVAKVRKENVAKNHDGKAAPYGSGYKKVNEAKYKHTYKSITDQQKDLKRIFPSGHPRVSVKAYHDMNPQGKMKTSYVEIEGPSSYVDAYKKMAFNGKGTMSDVIKSVEKNESVNEAKVNYNFSADELKRVLKLLGRNASTEVKMIKAFEKAFGRKLTRDELFESVNEAKSMDMKKRLKVYDKLKKGDKITIKYGSSMRSGREQEFVVSKGKTLVGKQKVERIILKNPANPKGVKYYLYQRNGNVTMAIGDMAATIEDMHESVNEGVFSNLDLIRQNSKDASDFIRNVFKDKDFKDMKNDKEFLKYLKSIYEGFSSDAQRKAAFASGYKAKGKKGKKKESIEEYDVENYQDIKEFAEFMKKYKSDVNEAEYQGRDVKLGKIMQGDVKKFKVYVKNPKGNVVKVNFGHKGKGGEKTMRIKKSDPARRKAFRSRHNCDNPGPRHKARYWACRTW